MNENNSTPSFNTNACRMNTNVKNPKKSGDERLKEKHQKIDQREITRGEKEMASVYSDNYILDDG